MGQLHYPPWVWATRTDHGGSSSASDAGRRHVGHGPLWTSSVALTSRVQRGRNVFDEVEDEDDEDEDEEEEEEEEPRQ